MYKGDQMNWKKIFLFTGVGAVVPTLEHWLQGGGPFTVGTIGVPIATTLLTTLLALFTHAPQNDATAAGQSDKVLPGAKDTQKGL